MLYTCLRLFCLPLFSLWMLDKPAEGLRSRWLDVKLLFVSAVDPCPASLGQDANWCPYCISAQAFVAVTSAIAHCVLAPGVLRLFLTSPANLAVIPFRHRALGYFLARSKNAFSTPSFLGVLRFSQISWGKISDMSLTPHAQTISSVHLAITGVIL